MRIAILILAHKNKVQLQRLINHLKADFDIYVHVDKKALMELYSNKNVIIIKRLPVYWGSYNLIIATLNLFKEANKMAYDRYLLISGQDVPIKSNNYIRSFFEDHSDQQFIEFERFPRISWSREHGGIDRIALYYPNKMSKDTILKWMVEGSFWVVRRVQRKFPRLQRRLIGSYWGGAQWLNLTGDCVEYLLNFISNHEGYLRSFRYTRCTDEIFFHTIILNSSFANTCVQNYLRYVDFDTGPEYPRTLREEDFLK